MSTSLPAAPETVETAVPAEPTLSEALLAEYAEQLRAQEEEYRAECAARHQRNLQLVDTPRTRANRANAQFSTGPRTLSGKEIAKMNAVRHGLTGRRVLLRTEEADAYVAHCERFRREWNPQTERELELTQMLADAQWRLNRVPNLELAIFAAGRVRYADLYLDADPDLRDMMIENHILEQSEKQFRNLALQENRLRRYLDRDRAELTKIQTARRERERMEAKAKAAEEAKTPQPKPTPDPERVRFSDRPKPAANQPNPAQNQKRTDQ